MLVDCEVPAELLSVTETEARALMSPWTVKDCVYRNVLPNWFEDVLLYQVAKTPSTSTGD